MSKKNPEFTTADDWIINALTEQYGVRKAHHATDNSIADKIRASLFPKQRAVLEDPSRSKAVLCPRRAGKSWTAMALAFDMGLRKPNSKSVIVTLTLKSAKNIYQKMVHDFAAEYGIECRFNHTELTTTLRNGSSFFMAGAETRGEIEKLRGGKYQLVIIDECKSYASSVLDELVTDVLKPALSDSRGTLMLIGTPGNVLDGLFYKATEPAVTDEDGRPFCRTYDTPEPYWVDHPKERVRWSRHSWTLEHNDRTVENLWENALNEKEDNRWGDDHPTWQREYLGRWVPAEGVYVYAYATLAGGADSDRVHWTPARTRENQSGLPNDGSDDWRYILGADLGYEDDFAIVVGAYSPTRAAFYHVWDYKANHQDFYQVVDRLQECWNRFGGFDAMVADASGLGKMVVETISTRHGLPIQRAEKTEKFDHIELLNADFHSGRIKIIPYSDLAIELATLQFDLTKHSKEELARAGKLREHPGLPNHLCDALLYAWRFSYHYWGAPKKRQYAANSPEWADLQEQAWMAQEVASRSDADTIWDQLKAKSQSPLRKFYGRK